MFFANPFCSHLKLPLYFLSIFIITGCNPKITTIQNTCRGSVKSLSRALKNPDKSPNVSIMDYQDSIFPPAGLLQLINLNCLMLWGKYPKEKTFNGIPSKLLVDTSKINELENIISLQISWFDLRSFPNGLFRLKNLQILYLDNCFLDSIPREIIQLQSLTLLSLRLNNISTVPGWLKELNNIEGLDLGNNSLDHIPVVLFELKNLKHISLSNTEGYKNEGFEPFELHTNKIDYVKEQDILIKLLSMQGIQKVLIDVESVKDRETLIEALGPLGLGKKIRINIRSKAIN